MCAQGQRGLLRRTAGAMRGWAGLVRSRHIPISSRSAKRKGGADETCGWLFERATVRKSEKRGQMGRSRKLRRYTRKDYDQVVDFPVEIVGRDSLVRRYPRVRAPLPAQDCVRGRAIHRPGRRAGRGRALSTADSAVAEVLLLPLRLVGSPVVDSPGMAAGDFAGEVVAFIRRVLPTDASQPGGIELPSSPTTPSAVFRTGGWDGRLADDDPVRVPVRGQGGLACARRILLIPQGPSGRAPGGEDVEHVAGFHHGADCQAGPTTTGADRGDGPRVDGLAPHAGDAPIGTPASTDWMETWTSGTTPCVRACCSFAVAAAAMRCCFVVAYETNHFRRSAYIGTKSRTRSDA